MNKLSNFELINQWYRSQNNIPNIKFPPVDVEGFLSNKYCADVIELGIYKLLFDFLLQLQKHLHATYATNEKMEITSTITLIEELERRHQVTKREIFQKPF